MAHPLLPSRFVQTLSLMMPQDSPASAALDPTHWHAVAKRRQTGGLPAPLSADEQVELRHYQRLYYGETLPDEVANGIEALGRAGTWAVVTGQQTGALGGPLYTMAKAASAVGWALELTSALQAPVVPMFWAASDDHDFAEASLMEWPDAQGNLRRQPWTYPATLPPHRPTSHIPWDSSVGEELASAWNEAHPDKPLPDDVAALLRGKPGDTLEAHFARIMGQLFAGTPLVFIAPRLSFMRRRAARAVMAREIQHPTASTRLVIDAGEALRATGQTPALHRHPQAVNAFVFDADGSRQRIEWLDDQAMFCIGRSDAAPGTLTSKEELLRRLEEHPEDFSPNVVTRPITQDACLPTLLFLGGPGELAYFRQLAPVYEHFGVSMPELRPRHSVMVVDSRSRRAASRLGFDVEELAHAAAKGGDAWEGFRAQALASEESAAWRQHVISLRERTLAGLEQFESQLAPQATATRRGLQKSISTITGSFDKLLEALERDALALSGQRAEWWQRIESSLRPRDTPQERVFNAVIPYVALHGWAALHAVRERIAREAPDGAGATIVDLS